jgi:hypothetical protein
MCRDGPRQSSQASCPKPDAINSAHTRGPSPGLSSPRRLPSGRTDLSEPGVDRRASQTSLTLQREEPPICTGAGSVPVRRPRIQIWLICAPYESGACPCPGVLGVCLLVVRTRSGRGLTSPQARRLEGDQVSGAALVLTIIGCFSATTSAGSHGLSMVNKRKPAASSAATHAAILLGEGMSADRVNRM